MTTINRVTVGHPVPDFDCHAVVDGLIKEVSLKAYKEANHWLILIFFPKAWSFIYPTEIRAFSARLEESLYSPSKPGTPPMRWKAACGVHVPLISDSNHKLSRDYGVLIEEQAVAQRALFIIDPRGMIRGIAINDADVGRSVDEAQRVLDALVLKDEFGDGCPIDWKKSDEGMDLATKTRVDGPIQVGAPPGIPGNATPGMRKSWTDWARPKLTRAFSNTSQNSIGSVMSGNAVAHGRVMSADAGNLPTLSTFHNLHSSLQAGELRAHETHSPLPKSITSSPMARPTSAVSSRYESLAPVMSPMSAEPSRMDLQMEDAM